MITYLVRCLFWIWNAVPEKLRALVFTEVVVVIFYVGYLFNGNYYGVYYPSDNDWILKSTFILPIIAYILSLLRYRVHQDSIKGIIQLCEIIIWLSLLGIMMGLYGSKEGYGY